MKYIIALILTFGMSNTYSSSKIEDEVFKHLIDQTIEELKEIKNSGITLEEYKQELLDLCSRTKYQADINGQSDSSSVEFFYADCEINVIKLIKKGKNLNQVIDYQIKLLNKLVNQTYFSKNTYINTKKAIRVIDGRIEFSGKYKRLQGIVAGSLIMLPVGLVVDTVLVPIHFVIWMFKGFK